MCSVRFRVNRITYCDIAILPESRRKANHIDIANCSTENCHVEIAHTTLSEHYKGTVCTSIIMFWMELVKAKLKIVVQVKIKTSCTVTKLPEI